MSGRRRFPREVKAVEVRGRPDAKLADAAGSQRIKGHSKSPAHGAPRAGSSQEECAVGLGAQPGAAPGCVELAGFKEVKWEGNDGYCEEDKEGAEEQADP